MEESSPSITLTCLALEGREGGRQGGREGSCTNNGERGRRRGGEEEKNGGIEPLRNLELPWLGREEGREGACIASWADENS